MTSGYTVSLVFLQKQEYKGRTDAALAGRGRHGAHDRGPCCDKNDHVSMHLISFRAAGDKFRVDREADKVLLIDMAAEAARLLQQACIPQPQRAICGRRHHLLAVQVAHIRHRLPVPCSRESTPVEPLATQGLELYSWDTRKAESDQDSRATVTKR